MTHDAYLTRENLPGKGFAETVTHCYQLSEPYDGIEYLTVSVTDKPKWNYQETLILPASDGEGAAFAAPDGSLGASIILPLCTHTEALESLGYTITATPTAPEPEEP